MVRVPARAGGVGARRARARGMRTRVLLVCAAFAVVQVLLNASLIPFAAGLAAASPPGYAVLAGLYSLMPFTARRFTDVGGAATLTALFSGLLVAAFSPIGVLMLVPLLFSAATFDGVLWLGRSRSGSTPDSAWVFIAAAASAASLFLVSLPVFSTEHLTPVFLGLTALGRLAGQLAAAAVALGLVRQLARAGVRSGPSREPQQPSGRTDGRSVSRCE
ncbi:hypothetical protein [Agromyces sp. H66]|uniref:hypothetical protein n=1 Tax=Agromyces sp. H66 TaxID=2529859 RepID=UPI0010AB137E|nr:hypothetical protein [Agromyces sp. H66]